MLQHAYWSSAFDRLCNNYLKLAATLQWSRPAVQSASLYDNFRKPGNYVIDDVIDDVISRKL